MTAVLSAGLVHGLDMQNAFAIALAAGTASCLKVKGSKYDIDDVKNILSGVLYFFVNYACPRIKRI